MSALDDLGGWPTLLADLVAGRDLTPDAAAAATSAILAGEATSAQVAAFLVALRAKGETAAELSAMLEAVRAAATPLPLARDVADRAIDVVGTGGDRSHSVNVSTMAALVVAGCGTPVCKHGNRAASSKCGTADVLEALGVRIDATPATVARCVEEAGIGFCLATVFHPAFRHAGPTRREIGVPTAFNLLGPMANPAPIAFMLVGVGRPESAGSMADALAHRGVHRAWVVHGHGGLDELSLSGPSRVVETHAGARREFEIDPADLGLPRAEVAEVRGGDPRYNADVVRETLAGAPGPVRDIVLLNAAAALAITGRVGDVRDGLEVARHSIDSGGASAALGRLVEMSNEEVVR